MKTFRQRILSFILVFLVLLNSIPLQSKTYAQETTVNELLEVIDRSLSVKKGSTIVKDDTKIIENETISFSVDYKIPTINQKNSDGKYVSYNDKVRRLKLAEGLKIEKDFTKIFITKEDATQIATGRIYNQGDILYLDVDFNKEDIFSSHIDVTMGIDVSNLSISKNYVAKNITILGKTYKIESKPQKPSTPIPSAEDKDIIMKKTAVLDDENNTIKWTITISSKSGADLSGYTLSDELNSVLLNYKENTLKINGIANEDAYDKTTKTIKYTFPANTNVEQKVEFETSHGKYDLASKDITNKAQLLKDGKEQAQASDTISKTNSQIGIIDKKAIFAKDHKELIENSNIKDIVNRVNIDGIEEHEYKEQLFNHDTKTVIYRISVNAHTNEAVKNKKVILEDKLPEGWEFTDIKDGQKYLILEAKERKYNDARADAITDAIELSKIVHSFKIEDNKAIFEFDNGLDKPYVILLAAKPTDDTLDKYINYYHNKDNQNKHYYPEPDNNATLYWDNDSARDSQKVIIRPKVLTKFYEAIKEDNNITSIKWSIQYRAYGDMKGSTIVDTLGTGIQARIYEDGSLMYNEGDFNIYEIQSVSPVIQYKKNTPESSDNNESTKIDSGITYKLGQDGNYRPTGIKYPEGVILGLNKSELKISRTLSSEEIKNYVSYDNNKRKLTFTIPDKNKSYLFEYITDVEKEGDVKNEVILEGYDNIKSSVTISESKVRASAKKLPYIQITKTEKTISSSLKPLADVTFELKDKNGKIVKITTDSNGIARTKYLAPGEYTLKENTPNGYKENDTIYNITVKYTQDNKNIECIIKDNKNTTHKQFKTIDKKFENLDIQNEKIKELNLEISKQVVQRDENGKLNPIELKEEDKEKLTPFSFTIELKGKDNKNIEDLTKYKYDLYNKKDSSDEYVISDKTDEINQTLKQKDGKYTFTLKHGQKIIIKDLEEVTKYTVTEKMSEDDKKSYRLDKITDKTDENKYSTVTGYSIERDIIKDKLNKIEFTNEKISDLEISKQVVQKKSGSQETETLDKDDTEFNFTITLEKDGKDIKDLTKYKYDLYNKNNLYEYEKSAKSDEINQILTEKDGKYTFKLKHNQKIIIKGLEGGIKYTVTEEETKDYKLSARTKDGESYTQNTPDEKSVTGEIKADKTSKIEFINEKIAPKPQIKKPDLEISKQVIGAEPIDSNKEFNFTIKLEKDGVDKTSSYKYDLYNKKDSSNEYVISAKTDEINQTLTQKDGKYTFTLKHNQKILIKDIEEDVKYTVTEDDYTGESYKLSARTKDGKSYTQNTPDEKSVIGEIKADKTSKIEFINEKIAPNPKPPTNSVESTSSSILIAKKVVDTKGNEISDDNKLFRFTLNLYDKDGNALYKSYDYYEVDDSFNQIGQNRQITNQGSFELKHGQKIHIVGLEENTRFTITEDDYSSDNYTLNKIEHTSTSDAQLKNESSKLTAIEAVTIKSTTSSITFVNLYDKPSSPPSDEETNNGGGGGGGNTPPKSEEKPTNPPTSTVPRNDPPPSNTPVTPPTTVPEEPQDISPNPPTDEPSTPIDEQPTPTVPRYQFNNLPNPYDPSSPDEIVVVDEDGVPLGTYIKKVNPDGTIEYILEDEDVPLGTSLPKTGQNNELYYILALTLILISYKMRKRR